jgi:hypothetical protein
MASNVISNTMKMSEEKNTPVLLSTIVNLQYSKLRQTLKIPHDYVFQLSIPSSLELEFDFFLDNQLLGTSKNGLVQCCSTSPHLTELGTIYAEASQQHQIAKIMQQMGVPDCGSRFLEDVEVVLKTPHGVEICDDPVTVPLTVNYYNIWRTKHIEPFGLVARWAFQNL